MQEVELSAQQVDLLDDEQGADIELEDCFFPGSDDELRCEVEDDDAVYVNRSY